MKKLSLITLLSVGAILTTACSQVTNQQTQKTETTTTTQQATEKKVVEEVKPNYDREFTLKDAKTISMKRLEGTGDMSVQFKTFEGEEVVKNSTLQIEERDKGNIIDTEIRKATGNANEYLVLLTFNKLDPTQVLTLDKHTDKMDAHPVYLKLKVGDTFKLSDIKFEKNRITEPVNLTKADFEKYEIKDGLAK